METMWECNFLEEMSSNPHLKTDMEKILPAFFLKNRGSLSSKKIIQSVCDGSFFGGVEVSIEVNL